MSPQFGSWANSLMPRSISVASRKLIALSCIPRDGATAAKFMSTPTRRICSGCCARAKSGHAVAETAIALMKSRRRTRRPCVDNPSYHSGSNAAALCIAKKMRSDVAVVIRYDDRHVRFVSIGFQICPPIGVQLHAECQLSDARRNTTA
jgi:hypothetical protein